MGALKIGSSGNQTRRRSCYESLSKDSISTEKMYPDEISFNAAISACEKCGVWDKALAILAAMSSKGSSTPGLITLNAAMSACEKGQRWTEALDLFSRARVWQLCPNEISWQVVLSACERATQWPAALQLLDHMLASQVIPSGTAAGSILHALVQQTLVASQQARVRAHATSSSRRTTIELSELR